jgi:hypothetical protein
LSRLPHLDASRESGDWARQPHDETGVVIEGSGHKTSIFVKLNANDEAEFRQ